MGQSLKDKSGLSPALSMRRTWRSTITRYVLNQNHFVSLLAFCSGLYFILQCHYWITAVLFFFLHFKFVLWNFSKNRKNAKEYYYVHLIPPRFKIFLYVLIYALFRYVCTHTCSEIYVFVFTVYLHIWNIWKLQMS